LERPIKVALVRGDRRRGTVAEALALLAPELKERVGHDPEPAIIPDLANPDRPWSCTHRDTLSAAVDAVLAAGASAVKLVGGMFRPGDRGRDPVRTLGYGAELWGRAARFEPVDPAPEHWSPILWIGPGGEPLAARAHCVAAASRCRIVLSVPRTHGLLRVGLGLSSLVGCLHPHDPDLCGTGRGTRSSASLSSLLASGRGRLTAAWLAVRSVSGGMRLTVRERRWLASAETAAARVAALAAFLRPAFSLIDGYSAIEGEGPRHGRHAGLNFVVAGTDALAVDAVAAAVMGFEPMEVASLRAAHRLGLATADLAEIEIIGDPLARARCRVRRHSADRLLRLAGHSWAGHSSPPRPHFGTSQSPLRERIDAHRV
jgi:uncharacterized protein (DUF362 family)